MHRRRVKFFGPLCTLEVLAYNLAEWRVAARRRSHALLPDFIGCRFVSGTLYAPSDSEAEAAGGHEADEAEAVST